MRPVANQRIWQTVDGKFVADEDPDARTLVAAEGDEIEDESLDIPAKFLASASKKAPAPENKMVAPDENKSAADDQSTAPPADAPATPAKKAAAKKAPAKKAAAKKAAAPPKE